MRKRTMVLAFFSLVTLVASAWAAEKGISLGDKRFMINAASGGMMEVQLGQMAQDKGKMQAVKDFGNRMVTDHGKANDELKQLAANRGIQLPAQPEHKDKRKMDKLSKYSGDEFDKKYMEAMVKDHTKDVADFKKATKKVKDPDLNAWAVKTLSVLEQHLQLAKETAEKVGVKVK